MVTATHSVIIYSDRMRKKYLSIVKRLAKNRAIVAIARVLIRTIYKMLKNGKEFIDRIDTLPKRKMSTMRSRAKRPLKVCAIEDFTNVMKERQVNTFE